MSLTHFEPNADYGTGAYRRLIRFVAREDGVTASIDDTHHAMWIRIDHSDGRIVEVDAGIERGPATSCGHAPAGLAALKGLAVAGGDTEVAKRLGPAENCTHLGDLVRWALARLGNGSTEYLVTVPDEVDEAVWIDIRREGTVVHRWLVRRDSIVSPARLAGRPLLRGFRSWVVEAFAGEELEAAMMLHRGAWVARARRYSVDRRIVPLRSAAGMEGACFSYSGANWNDATNNLNYVRDFTRGIVEHPLPARATRPYEERGHDAR